MPIQSAKVGSLHLKALVQAVLKFPPSALVSSSEIINLEVSRGRLRASVFGLVEASAAVLATGEGIQPFSIDYRVLSPYAELCPDMPVLIEVNKTQVLFTCGEHTLKVPFTVGRVVAKRATGTELFVADEAISKTVRWLASIVGSTDFVKPDNACVFLSGEKAMAMNQYCIAISKVAGLPKADFPLPLVLCGVLAAGDKVTTVKDGLVVSNELGTYAVPFLYATLRFPVKQIDRLLKAEGTVYGACEASTLIEALQESLDCVARIPKTVASLTLTFGADKAEVDAASATAEYHTSIAVADGHVGAVSFPLLEAHDAMGIFSENNIIIKRLEPKGDVALLGTEAFVFFAPSKQS